MLKMGRLSLKNVSEMLKMNAQQSKSSSWGERGMDKETAGQEKLKILIADDLDDVVEGLKGWIRSYWPHVELHVAQTPEAAVALACEEQIENLILDLNFGERHELGIVIARRVMEARRRAPEIPTRVVFRTAHADNEGYLRQVEQLVSDEKLKPTAWGFLDKGAIPKRIALNAFEQVFIYGIPHTDVFNERLRQPPFRQLSSLEYTVLVYTCLGVTNFGIGWLLKFSDKKVERIIQGIEGKLKVPSGDQEAKKPALFGRRMRLYYVAVIQGLINNDLLREEDETLRRKVKGEIKGLAEESVKVFIDREWLDQ
jgi:DNA-binding NarL/FixJ family response regulator